MIKLSKFEERNYDFKSVVLKKKKECRQSYEGLADILGCCEQTIRNKINDPSKFTVGELDKLFKVLKFTDAEKITAFVKS